MKSEFNLRKGNNMKIIELLKNFFGNNEVQIKDDFNYDIHSFKNYEQAILYFGHYTVKNWHIENNVLYISIQSQF